MSEKHTAYVGAARDGEDDLLFCSKQCAKDYEASHEKLWNFGEERFTGDIKREWGDDYPCDHCGKIVVLDARQAEIERLQDAIETTLNTINGLGGIQPCERKKLQNFLSFHLRKEGYQLK